MKRRTDAPTATDTAVPPFDPSTRGSAFETVEGVFLAANLYASRHNIPDRYTAAARLAEAWLAAHP